MKYRDTPLDFTSLLDIVLIILFFFVLYGSIDAGRAEEEAQTARAEYEEKLADLDAEQDRLDAEQGRLDAERERMAAEWDRLARLDENAAGNQRALDAFGRGDSLSLILMKEDDSASWTLSAVRGEDPVGQITPGEEIAEAVPALLRNLGLNDSDTALVTFVYDGSVLGTHLICRNVLSGLEKAQAAWGNLYINTINISR